VGKKIISNLKNKFIMFNKEKSRTSAKKIIIAALFLLTLSVIITSCGASRGVGCPGAAGIIH
jgi:hypothetical protein